jgi:CotS family spore coat protein
MTRVKADVHIGPDQIKSLIKEHYSLEVNAIEKVRGVYKVETPKGTYGFKNAEELPDLPFIADCLQTIKENGFERIPGFLLANSGNLLIHDGDDAYFMEEWLDFLKEVPKNSLPYLKKIGAALADFHHATRKIPIPSRENFRFQWGKRQSLLEKASQHILNWKQQYSCTSSSSFRSLECSILHFLHKRCWLAYESIKDVSPHALIKAAPQSAVWCHGGLHHKNIMLDSKEQVWFIDFETMVYGERVMDLAQLLQYHAWSFHWQPAGVQTFLQAYNSSLSEPIDQQEWKIFLSYLMFPRRLYTRMKRYFGSNNPKPEHLFKLKETVDSEMEKEKFLSIIHTISV